MTIRVWAEYLTPEEAAKKEVINLLGKYGVILGMSFPPGSMNREYARLLGEYEQAGSPVMLWPLMSDELGYWPSERTAVEFPAYIEEIFDWADKNKVGFPWLAVDMEPPHYQMDSVKKASPAEKLKLLGRFMRENRNRGRFYDAVSKYNKLVEAVHGRGVKVLSAVADITAADISTGSIGIQDLLETPVSPINWDMFSFMIYTSMMTGYSKGLLTERDARRHLYRLMRNMKEALWDRAGVSIGVTYIGKLGDEPYYETPEELKPDMQAVKAALIEDVSIFNLEGILRSDRPEEWFETLIECEPKTPGRSLKIDAYHNIGKFISRIL